MAFRTILIMILALAAFSTAEVTTFYASPENSTYMIGDGEENRLSLRFTCVAINAYMIDWTVNGSEMNGGTRHTHQSTVSSTLQYDVPVGDNVEVMCRAWPREKDSPYLESTPATISVVTCNCNNGSQQNGTESLMNATFTSLITYQVPLGIVLFIMFALVVVVIVLVIILLCRDKRCHKSEDYDGIEKDGVRKTKPRNQGGESIRRRQGQRR